MQDGLGLLKDPFSADDKTYMPSIVLDLFIPFRCVQIASRAQNLLPSTRSAPHSRLRQPEGSDALEQQCQRL